MVLRHKVLRGDMSKYTCCQGYFNICCIKGGALGEQSCPHCCLCLEACLCHNLAVSASRMYVMDEKNLSSDPCDRRIIRINNCCQCFACIFSLIACITGQCGELADLINHCADFMYLVVQACMTAQVNYELNHENDGKLGGPQTQVMQ